MKKWKCTVCGYIHTGEEPPEKCPVCGADRSKFVEVTEAAGPAAEEKTAAPAVTPEPAEKDDRDGVPYVPEHLSRRITQFHVHPISVHIPNGVLPLSVLFIALSLLFDFQNLSTAAFWNLVFVALAMPLVLFSGYNDWHRRFNGNMTGVFLTKIICGVVVLTGAPVLVIHWAVNPDILATASAARIFFLLLSLVVLAAAVTAGYMGGKLVFPNQDS